MLAYDIISQVGYMAVGIGVGTALTLDGTAAHAYAHILYKSLLFMSVGCLIYSLGTDRLEKLGGFGAAPALADGPLHGGRPVDFRHASVQRLRHQDHDHRRHRRSAPIPCWRWRSRWPPSALSSPSASACPISCSGGAGPTACPAEATWKPIPWNMYAGMILAAVLCIAQGVAPAMLYRFLPYAVETPFEPWTAWHVLQALLMLGFGGLAVYLLRGTLKDHAGVNLDLDYFYRLIGRGVLALVCRRWPGSTTAGPRLTGSADSMA